MFDDEAKSGTVPTVDLAEIAQIGRGTHVAVRDIGDPTQELFDNTLALVEDELGPDPTIRRGRRSLETEFVPRNDDLRAIFLLAEAVGGYEAFNDLVNEHSPGHLISQDFGGRKHVTRPWLRAICRNSRVTRNRSATPCATPMLTCVMWQLMNSAATSCTSYTR